MEIKEMSPEEKYDKLLDDYLLSCATGYALHKELGVVDKCLDLSVKAHKKMLPSYMGPVFKLMKMVAPGRTFKQTVDRSMYMQQVYQPLSSIEVIRVSDRESVTRIKNCNIIRRLRDLVKKAGLDIDPKFYCEAESLVAKEMAKEFGVDLTRQLEEDGCTITAKLK